MRHDPFAAPVEDVEERARVARERVYEDGLASPRRRLKQGQSTRLRRKPGRLNINTDHSLSPHFSSSITRFHSCPTRWTVFSSLTTVLTSPFSPADNPKPEVEGALGALSPVFQKPPRKEIPPQNF